MRVERVLWSPYSVLFRQPYRTARGQASHRQGVLVKVRLENGVEGLGEAALLPEDDGFEALQAAVADAACRVSGQDAQQAFDALAAGGELVPETEPPAAANAARNALDCALLDALARQRGVPVCHLLAPGLGSSPCLVSVPVNALVTDAEPAAAARAAAVAVEEGFSTVKLKVGMLASLDEECARVVAVREAVGPSVALRLDANGAWSEEQAVAVLHACEPLGIEYVEQPVAPGNPEALARVQAAVVIPIAADEDVDGLDAALSLIDSRAVRVLVLKPQVVGGLSVAHRIYEAAQAADIRCVVTSSIETGVGVAAALHLAATMPNAPAAGLATLSLLIESFIEAPGLPIVRGRLAVPQTPGLGILCSKPWQDGRA